MCIWVYGSQCIWWFTFMVLWLTGSWPAAAVWRQRVLCHVTNPGEGQNSKFEVRFY